MKFFALLSIMFLSVACIKTADQVHREKRFDSMSEQMGDTQGLVANMVSQMKDMQSQLDRMNGRLEVLEHNAKKVDPEQLKLMSENMTLLKTQSDAQSSTLSEIQNELKACLLYTSPSPRDS